jgi:magnesium chelatase accessory protein
MPDAAAPPTDWARESRTWPHHAHSRFVAAGGLLWHVQQMGSGPVLLLLHGTGASTHSVRGLMPLLARAFTVIAADLPGHGFTQRPEMHGLSLPGMAAGVTALLEALGVAPECAVGHSAGAAILARMSLDGGIAPRSIVSLCGAMLPMEGVPGQVFSMMARVLVRNRVVPHIFAWRAADPNVVTRLLRGTGSVLDGEGIALYVRLTRRPGHAAAALGMMANWDLRPLARDLPRLRPKLLLVAGANDRSIPHSSQLRVQALVPRAELITLPGLGHLAHEEQPEMIADIILHACAPVEA